MPNEFKIRNGLVVDAGGAQITGSLAVSSSSSNFNGNVQITGSASNSLLVKGSGTTNATNTFRVEDSAGTPSLLVRDDKKVVVGGSTTIGAAAILNVDGTNQGGVANAWIVGSNYSQMVFGSGTSNGQYAEFYRPVSTGDFIVANLLKNTRFSVNYTTDYTSDLTINYSTDNNWVGVNTSTAIPYIKNFPLVVKGNPSSDAYATLALSNTQPLIKWSGSYNSGNGAELYQNGSGTFLLNTNSSINGFAIYSDGSPAFAGTAGTKAVFGSLVPSSAQGKVHIRGLGATSATNALYVENSNASASFSVRDDGLVTVMPNNANITIDGSTSSGGRIIIQNPTSNALIGINSYNTFLYPTELVLYARSAIKGATNVLGDLRFYNITTGKTYMFMTETGLVSINKGTVIPNADLDVSGSVIITGSLTVITGSNIEFRVLNTGVKLGNVIGDAHTVTGSFSVSGSITATSITSSGAFIAQANNAMYFRGGDDAEFWDVNIANTVGIRGQQDDTKAGITLGKNGPTIFGTGSNVGIGTTSPSERLHIAAVGNGGDVPLYISGSNTKGGASYLDFLYVDNTGGGSNPKKYFRIDGNGSWEVINNAYTQTIFSLDDTGNLTINGTLTQGSDISLKTNIQTIPNALEKTLQLRGVEYDRISTNKHELGLIAQEVEQVLPELVSESNGIKSVAYSNVVSILVESIKELKQEIDILREQINKK